MTFRINNVFGGKDYRNMVRLLSDKKSSDDEDEDTSFRDEPESIRLVRDTELDLPLARLGNSYVEEEQAFSEDHKNYLIRIPVIYESRENGFENVVKLLPGRIPSRFSVNVGKKSIELHEGEFGYRVTCVGSTINIVTLRERKISQENLKRDISTVLGLVELVVNAVYDDAGREIELEVSTKLLNASRRINVGHRRNVRSLKAAIAMEKPSVTFDEIGGCAEAKSELTLLSHGLKNPEAFKKWGIQYPRGILLHGLPGTGKTLLAKAMANLAHASLYCVSATDVLSCYYGESPKMVSKVFELAQRHSPAIILFDEIDSLAMKRDGAFEESGKIVSVFLQKMDGIKAMNKVTVIGTTNFKESIDPALLRPGRFDKIIEVPPPDASARADIFRLHCSGKKVCEQTDYKALAEMCDGFTGADIAETVQIALSAKLKEELNTGNKSLLPVGFADLASAIDEYRKHRNTPLAEQQNKPTMSTYR